MTAPGRRWWPAVVVVGAALMGTLATLGLGRLLGPEPTAAVPPESTTTTTLLPQWFHPAEVVLGPAVLVPEPLEAIHGGFRLTYRLEPITPGSQGPEDAAESVVYPDTWTLVTDTGTVTARSMPWTREVEFPAPPGLTLSQIREVRLDSYWLLVPVRVPFHPARDDFAGFEVLPGVTAGVFRIHEQSTGDLVSVDLHAADGFMVADLAVRGTGAGWRPPRGDQLGGSRWTSLFDGEDLPDPLPLEVYGTAWILRESEIVIDPRGRNGS